VRRRRPHTRKGVTNGGVVLGEAARGPREAAVPCAVAQGCHPSAVSLPTKTFTRCHLVSVGKCGPWVEEVSQARRIHRRRFDQAGALQLIRPQVTIGLAYL